MSSLYLDNSLEWTSVYLNRIKQLGNTATLFNFGDIGNFGALNVATGVGMKFNASGLSPTWTWQDAGGPIAFATPFDLALESNWQGLAPKLTLNNSDEEADTPDAAFWSRVTTAYSMGMWIRPSDVTSVALLNKIILTGSSEDAEWEFSINSSSKLELKMYDTSAATTNWTMERPSSASIVADVWTFVVATCNATQTAATDINLYINGAVDNGSGAKGASFTAMEAGAATVSMGFRVGASANEQFYGGPIAGGPYCPFFVQAELTAAQILNMYSLERLGMGL